MSLTISRGISLPKILPRGESAVQKSEENVHCTTTTTITQNTKDNKSTNTATLIRRKTPPRASSVDSIRYERVQRAHSTGTFNGRANNNTNTNTPTASKTNPRPRRGSAPRNEQYPLLVKTQVEQYVRAPDGKWKFSISTHLASSSQSSISSPHPPPTPPTQPLPPLPPSRSHKTRSLELPTPRHHAGFHNSTNQPRTQASKRHSDSSMAALGTKNTRVGSVPAFKSMPTPPPPDSPTPNPSTHTPSPPQSSCPTPTTQQSFSLPPTPESLHLQPTLTTMYTNTNTPIVHALTAELLEAALSYEQQPLFSPLPPVEGSFHNHGGDDGAALVDFDDDDAEPIFYPVMDPRTRCLSLAFTSPTHTHHHRNTLASPGSPTFLDRGLTTPVSPALSHNSTTSKIRAALSKRVRNVKSLVVRGKSSLV